ncbi:putative signal peptide protein [Puccinia sorghi]|uniref:Putative signal peptide protein n=1 Tax=Puccinia sorghi TaxID=27349 RepID=A0A0L6UQI7_9BASI|nr:putative signal peptide protein [Puccinia sorghi]
MEVPYFFSWWWCYCCWLGRWCLKKNKKKTIVVSIIADQCSK